MRRTIFKCKKCMSPANTQMTTLSVPNLDSEEDTSSYEKARETVYEQKQNDGYRLWRVRGFTNVSGIVLTLFATR